jgi:hypothetical protein
MEMANELDFEALSVADKTIKFLYERIQGRATSRNLKRRISARINETLMNLLRCLKDPNMNPNPADFQGTDWETIITSQSPNRKTLLRMSRPWHWKMSWTINEAHDELEPENGFKSLKQEFTAFAKTGTGTDNLQKLEKALLTIKPTSTRFGVRLSEKSFSALVFLKSYYKIHSKNV